jgi:uncharacterized membrane protein YphA (DoxX/SURF4 family)
MLYRLTKKLTWLTALPLVCIVAGANWFVHQPRHWQQAQAARAPEPFDQSGD